MAQGISSSIYSQGLAAVIMAAKMTLKLACVLPVTLKQQEDVSTLAAIQKHAAVVFVLLLICATTE